MTTRKPRAKKSTAAKTRKPRAKQEPKKLSMLYSFLPDQGLVEFVIIKTQGDRVWADDPENRFALHAITLPAQNVVLESHGAFFGLDAACVLQAARNHYAPLLAQSRNVLRLLSSGEQHIIRMGRAANRRGGRTARETRHQRGLVLDDETLAIWEEFSGDRSKGVRYLMKKYGIPQEVERDYEQLDGSESIVPTSA